MSNDHRNRALKHGESLRHFEIDSARNLLSEWISEAKERMGQNMRAVLSLEKEASLEEADLGKCQE